MFAKEEEADNPKSDREIRRHKKVKEEYDSWMGRA